MIPRFTPQNPLKVGWFTYFPIEWLPDLPAELKDLPRIHPAPWQRILFQEIQKEQAMQLHVVVVRKQFPRTFSFQRGNCTFHCMRPWGSLRAPSLFWVDTMLVRRALKPVRPHLVHAWGTENGAALVASRLPYPSLVTMQGLMRWLLELGLIQGRYQKLVAYLEGRSLRRAQHVTAESSFAVGYLKKHYPHLDLHQVEHAPNWEFHQAVRHPATSPIEFLCISTLGHAKGTDVLLQALDPLVSSLPFKVTLIGSGSEETIAAYKSSVSAELWSRITLRQHLTSAEVAEAMTRATIMIYPTRADNSPNAVKEAVVMGLPVVASRIGGIVDYVVPGKNGMLFETGNVQSCHEAIRAALADSLMAQGKVDPNTHSQMRDYLSPLTMKDKFLRLYHDIAQL